MKLTFGVLSVSVALTGAISFVFLVVAIGTDFWYIIDASKLQTSSNSSDHLSSHSGLWRTCKFQSKCFHLINPFWQGDTNFTDSQRQLLTLVTLGGVSVYIGYSAAAFKAAVCLSGKKILEDINIRFGWSLALAWISFVAEVFTGVAFIIAAKLTSMRRRQEEAT
ncbi:transmembrane protein 114 isoform X2 [Chiloscyllium punctatum]|uniref:transmembrane protein 114 isoform X2 n=1 Tax=Chiloscyllium punctatum TaxID=137246 RepID=UPI003B63293A